MHRESRNEKGNLKSTKPTWIIWIDFSSWRSRSKNIDYFWRSRIVKIDWEYWQQRYQFKLKKRNSTTRIEERKKEDMWGLVNNPLIVKINFCVEKGNRKFESQGSTISHWTDQKFVYSIH